ncbi:MAG: DUF4248 domain-containing protein [Bacteroidales bacterium]
MRKPMTTTPRSCVSIKELACRYFPYSLPESAAKHLRVWIKRNEQLLKLLLETGYCKHQRVLTPLQTDLIFHYLGEPD